MLEQPMVTQDDSVVPLDALLGDGFAVIGLNCQPDEELHLNDRKALDRFDAKRIVITTESDREADGCDTEKVLLAFCQAERA
ncbi:MAG: hypothetical protein AAF680_13360, partial [Pseudomonadota bacterium]